MSNENKNQTPNRERLLRLKEVQERVGLCGSHIYNLIREGKFPSPIKLLGGRTSAWVESEISAWIDNQISAGRDEGEAA